MHELTELDGGKVEQATDELGAHGLRPRGRRRSQYCKPRGMPGKHDLEQMAVEPLGPVLHLGELQVGCDVEILGEGAALEIEIDHAASASAVALLAGQRGRGRQAQRRRAGAADGGHERGATGLSWRTVVFGGAAPARRP